MAQRLKTDWILFVTVLAMMSFGVLILYSASSIIARLDPRYNLELAFRGPPTGMGCAGAVGLMMALKKVHYRNLQTPAAVAFGAIGVAMMLLFAVYILDGEHHRWLRLGGPLRVQPSENRPNPHFVVFLAFFVTWRGRAINNPRVHAGSGCSGGRLDYFRSSGGLFGNCRCAGRRGDDAGLLRRRLGVALLLHRCGDRCWVWASAFSSRRNLTAWGVLCVFSIPISRLPPSSITKAASRPGPNNRCVPTIRTISFNNRRFAVGVGGVTGVGLMNGRQKLLYLPFAHTDFIYAVAGEELGLIGSVAYCFLASA